MGFFEIVAARVLMRIMLYGGKEIFNVDKGFKEAIKGKFGKVAWIVDEQEEDVEPAMAYNMFKDDKFQGEMGPIPEEFGKAEAEIHFKTAQAAIELMRASKTVEDLQESGELYIKGNIETVREFAPLMDKLELYMRGLG